MRGFMCWGLGHQSFSLRRHGMPATAVVPNSVNRRDKALLTETFQTLAFDITVGQLIALGHLCKVGEGFCRLHG